MITFQSHRRFKCKDGKLRNFIIFKLNDVEILRIKDPFEENYETGFDLHTHITDVWLDGNKLFMIKTKFGKSRQVYYPISKKKLCNSAL